MSSTACMERRAKSPSRSSFQVTGPILPQACSGGTTCLSLFVEEGLHRLPDNEILGLALREQRIVLTFDLDFGDLLELGSLSLPSVIIFRLEDQTPDSVTPRLLPEALEGSLQVSRRPRTTPRRTQSTLRRLQTRVRRARTRVQ